jgi:hypothetical protein
MNATAFSSRDLHSVYSEIISRLSAVRPQRGGGATARCPAHDDREPSLSVKIGDHAVVLHDFGGCSAQSIVASIGMTMADLFPKTDDAWGRQQDGLRRQMRATPVATTRAMLRRELDRVRAAQRKELGYDSPVTSRTINEVRVRVGRIVSVELAPVAPFIWECAPHDSDPLWPTLFERALEQEVRRRWHALYPEAQGWETDPGGHTVSDVFRAQRLAAEWLHPNAQRSAT